MIYENIQEELQILKQLPEPVVAWFRANKRKLPWRVGVGDYVAADPRGGGEVLLSEISGSVAGCEGTGRSRGRSVIEAVGRAWIL